MKPKEKLFGIEFGDGVHDLESDTVEVEIEEEEEAEVVEEPAPNVEEEEADVDDEEDFLAEYAIPRRSKKSGKREKEREIEDDGEIPSYGKPKSVGWKKFAAVGAVVVVFMAIVAAFSLYSSDSESGGDDGNSELPAIAMEVKYENAGFNIVVAANEDRVFGVEAILFGGSNWPVGCDFDDGDSWPVSDFGANRYTFRSEDIRVVAGEVKTIFVSFNTLETWHCEFTLHEMVGSETQEVLVNMS